MKLFVIAAAATALLVATPASALTIIQSSAVANANTGVTTAVSFDQFDVSLGNLDSVVLSFEAIMPGVSGTLKNNPGTSRTFTLTRGTTAGLTGNGFSLSTLLGAGTQTVGPIAPSQTVNIGPFAGSGADTDTLTGNLSAFIGLGDVAFNFTRTSQFSINPSAATLTIAPQIGGAVTLAYNYTAPVLNFTPSIADGVPEPTTWATMIIGFFGMGSMMRRRRAMVLA